MNCFPRSLNCVFDHVLQLEFSLLALRADPLPILQGQLSALRSSGNESSSEAAEIVAKIANEQSKRSRWDVSLVF